MNPAAFDPAALSPATFALDDLASSLAGTLTRPGDADWDDVRRAWQLLVDQYPVAVVAAADQDDVSRTIRAAAALGLRVAAQSTGHNASPLGDLSRTILLRTSRLDEIRIDVDGARASVGAGVTWGALAAEASRADLIAVGGFSADVGVVGLLLGGGLGWFARSHGTAAESVLGFDVVTADGVERRVDAEHEADLFVAILAGADVAVITSVELALHRIGEVAAGALFWPAERARDVFHAWVEWSRDLPEAVTSVVRVLRFPDAPGVPPAFSGRAFAIVEAVVQGGLAEADQLLEPLRALSPAVDTFATTAPGALAGLHMDPPQPTPALGSSAVLDGLPAEAVDAIVDAVIDGDARSLTSVELRDLGGALGRADASAFASARALLFGVAGGPDSVLAAADAAFAALDAAVATVRAERDVSTFTEVAAAPERLFGAELERLMAAKRLWDPANLIHANHSVLARA